MAVKLRVYSDLHLEFGNFKIPNPSLDEVLVLAGDIGVGKSARNWLEKYIPQFKAVIYVAGNHEFYNNNIDKILDYWKNVDLGPTFHFLENDTVTIDDTLFVGATFWTDFKGGTDIDAMWEYNMKIAKASMNDYYTIKKYATKEEAHAAGQYAWSVKKDKQECSITPTFTVLKHLSSYAFIWETLRENTNKKVVVVTHHTPSKVHLNRDRYPVSALDAAYWSDCSKLLNNMKYSPDVWISGHTHKTVDVVEGLTRLVSNPRGYVGHDLNKAFDEGFTIDV